MSTQKLESGRLENTLDLLARKYGDLGRQAGHRLARWLADEVPHAYAVHLERHLSGEHLDLLFDAFYQVLPFGTGGRRGRVGYGSNRLNPTTVAMTVQGHCDYLKTLFPEREELCVAVANDVRAFHDVAGTYRHFLGDDHPLVGLSSRALGRLACEVYAGNGIAAYFMEPDTEDALLTTPELSFAISKLQAVGGINVSASHNPPDDNGVKLYDQFGSQPVAPDDQRLIEAMERATVVRSVAFQDALASGLVRPLPEGLHEQYLRTYVDIYAERWRPSQVPIVFTPLCGCGLNTVGDLLGRLDFPVLTPPEEGPDGSFAVIPMNAPNPEVPQATEPARAYADAEGAGIVLSSDPDADRVGLEVRLQDGSWYHCDGNQIGVILCYFLMLDPNGPQRRGLVLETLVTSKILGRIVERAGDSWIVDDLLVGFKYVADALKSLATHGRYREITGSPTELVLAAEESHGVIVTPKILDKDAAPACMFLAALHQRLAREGRTLLDYYIEILEQLGGYDCVNRSIVMLGAEGMMRKNRLMASLRQSPPARMGGDDVVEMLDRWDEERFGPFVSESEKLPRNVLQLATRSFILTVRPSGTEAKVKLYVQLMPQSEDDARSGRELLERIRQRATRVAETAYNELLARIGASLGEVGLLLPDIVDLDRKLEFEEQIVPRLRDALIAGQPCPLDHLLEWLREQVALMTPGADPLPAVKTSVARLCGLWQDEMGGRPLFEQLRAWATA